MKALIIDDSPLTRAILKDYLVDYGFEVFEAGTSYEASELFKKVRPELVVKDLYMAGWEIEDSVKFFKKIDPRVKILICSTVSPESQELLIKGLRAGANDFLPKPLNRDQIAAVMQGLGLN